MSYQKGHATEAFIRKMEYLEYIRSLLGELTVMARAENEQMISHLIEMAYIEVSDVLRERNRSDVILPAKVA